MHPTAERIQKILNQTGFNGQVLEFSQSTRTAQEAAEAANCQLGQIVKSLMFLLAPEEKPLLFLVSGENRVHEKHVGKLLGGKLLRADADTVQKITGFAIGGIPPLGHTTILDTYLDEDLLQYDTVWAAAGTPNAVFEIAPTRLLEITQAGVICVK